MSKFLLIYGFSYAVLHRFFNCFYLCRKPTFKDTLRELTKPSSLKPFGILVTYFMMYQFSGVNTITFYAVQIFQETGTTIDKNACTILLGVTRLIFTIGAAIAMRLYGRRTLTFVSGKFINVVD